MSRLRSPPRTQLRVSLLLLALALPLLAGGCPEECRVDADCPLEEMVQRCSEAGACVPLEPAPQPSCETAAECEGGRSCYAGACVFTPGCQVFSDIALSGVVECTDGALFRTAARADTQACNTSLSLSDVDGEPRRVDLGAVPPQGFVQASLDTDNDALRCGRYEQVGAKTVFILGDCRRPLTDSSCRIGLVRQSEGLACFEDLQCPDGLRCERASPRTDESLGVCR